MIFERLGFSRAMISERIDIPASTLHGLYHGMAKPNVDDLEKLSSILEPSDRVELVTAHLRDETPASAADLIRIVSLIDTPKVKEEPAEYGAVKLPKKVREDFEFLMRMAQKDQRVVESIRSDVRMIKGLLGDG
jgi:hypothetical protein